MALSAGAKMASLQHYNKPAASEEWAAFSARTSALSPTHRYLLTKLSTPVRNSTTNSSRSISTSCSAHAPIGRYVLVPGLPDGKQNSDPRRRVSTAASSSSNSFTAATTASLLRSGRSRREFFAGSSQIVLRRARPLGTLLHGHNQGAGGQFDCSCRAEAKPGAEIIVDDVPHLSEYLPDLPSFSNPLHENPAYRAVTQYFVENDDIVAKNVVVKQSAPTDGIYFRRAGPRESVVFHGDEVRACIVTCGGLCPGLNTVVREIVCGLWTNYGVQDILGIEGGYAGFYSSNTIQLNPKVVNDIHKRGGTILRTSRGGNDMKKIVAAILDHGINQVYIIGGDGTQRGAQVIHEELKKLKVKVVVAGIPKTIDNDIGVIDKSFGFDTAVEEAQRAINAAHVEAQSVKNGVGVVKLMGRYSGYIAMYATLASRDVDCCLIPEVPFYLDGPGGLYEFARRRLRESGHMVIVVAEGAGQEIMLAELSPQLKQSDASGNHGLLDVGLWLSKSLRAHFAGNKEEALTLKYIDPTYMVRAVPSNASDNVYCTLLAHSAIHGAMAGYTGFMVGPVNGRHAYIPIAMAVETLNTVNVSDRMWARLLSSTQQPDFLNYDNAIGEKRKTMSQKPKSSLVSLSNGSLPKQAVLPVVQS